MTTYIKIFLLPVLFLSFLNINTASSQLRFGIKGGFDVVNNRINKDILNAHNRLGFQIGGTMELMAPLVGWGGEMSVLYGYQKGDKNLKDVDDNAYELSDYHYLRVPLNLKKKFTLIGLTGLFIQAGPYAEFKLSGADVKRLDEQWEARSFGMGVNAGAGIDVFDHFELGLYYRKSLTDNYGENQNWGNIVKKRPDNWSVRLTYFF